MKQNFPDNALYEMDNLDVLRGMNSETVDLIATDPPFNTKRNRAGTAGFYVDNWKWGDTGILPDQWKWNEVHPKWMDEIEESHPALHAAIEASKLTQGGDTAAFLCFLSVRLIEMRRVLKPTGSIYLHCDATASHYIKTCMDAVWGKQNFRNEIIWHYKNASRGKKQWAKSHEHLFWYSNSDAFAFNREDVLAPYESGMTAWRYEKQGKVPPKGKTPDDVIILPALNTMSNERTGSPDQKPLELYERIIKASSNEGDLVLDPFCGCATTIIAANNLGRRWVGIDRRVDARFHIVTRLMGVDKKERERLKKVADPAWLAQQEATYESHFRTEAPTRMDEQKEVAAKLGQVYETPTSNPHSKAEMKALFLEKFGCKCWGCGYEPPDARFLQVDHALPKSGYGNNYINNRSLLCQPCNSKKGNRLTLIELRRQNKREGLELGAQINLAEAQAWLTAEMVRKIQEGN